MNHEKLNELVSLSVMNALSSIIDGFETVEEDSVIESDAASYISYLQEEISSLQSENSDLKEELAERTIGDLLDENEMLEYEIKTLKSEHNSLIDMLIDLLEDERL